tara:strand:+ start:131 stop:853 length:723 start_codon:yes stop_codon:yes gene_type:complete
MNLVIDIGNSRCKIAIFKSSEMIYNEVITKDNFIKKISKLIINFNCNRAIISSVGFIKKSELDELETKIDLIKLNPSTKIPFLNKYSTPNTLGVDRIALVSSAVSKYPDKNVLIIDAGTCITYDFVNNEKQYLGGAISPGIKMRYNALHEFTQNLPLIEPENVFSLIGNSTEKCIHSGVINGVIIEIDGVINEYLEKNQDLTVVLTGGDVKFLSNKLKNGIFANPFFLLEGLNTILTYNL